MKCYEIYISHEFSLIVFWLTITISIRGHTGPNTRYDFHSDKTAICPYALWPFIIVNNEWFTTRFPRFNCWLEWEGIINRKPCFWPNGFCIITFAPDHDVVRRLRSAKKRGERARVPTCWKTRAISIVVVVVVAGSEDLRKLIANLAIVFRDRFDLRKFPFE